MNTYRIVRMLNWPFLWRFAVRIAERAEHEQEGHCLPCLAKARRERDAHKPMVYYLRTIVCAKCGLPEERWQKKPRCSNKWPVPIRTRVRQAVTLFVGWD